jgi:hypothetical protein
MTWLPRSPCSTLVLWLNHETVNQLHLVVLATMRPALDPAGHRVPRTKPTCLLHTWRPHRQRPYTLVLHLHQHESNRNLHLQYLVKNQSTQLCQSLITKGSDHPPVLEPHMVLTLSLLWNIYMLKRRSGVRDKLRNVILQQSNWLSVTTPIQLVLGGCGHRLLTLFGGRAAEYSGTGQGV